jgi:membrane-associated phospholipid phosphatase
VRIAGLALGALLLVAADRPLPGYLEEQAVPDLMRVLPKPPAAGSPRDLDDAATFRRTRALRGGERWALATSDVTDDRFTVFACAMGMKLDAARAPALARLFARMGDAGMVGRAKDGFAVKRPYLKQTGEICEAKTAHLGGNGDYPSGHTSNGWATALVLAELMPSRATEILRRGRIYGESRFACGSHSRSAVEAGYLSGAAVVAAWHGSAAFRADMDAARAELQALRDAPAADARQCHREANADLTP